MPRKRKSRHDHDPDPAPAPTPAPTRSTPSSSKTKSPKHQKKLVDWKKIKTPVPWKVQPIKATALHKRRGVSSAKRRKLEDDGSPDYDPDDDPEEPNKHQSSPFEGTNVGEAYYQIKPSAIWLKMARYRKFSIQKDAFMIGDFVYVKHLDIEHDAAESDQEDPTTNVEKRWVAKVLEVRATDALHVFLRVYWMYKPEDLPTGRLPYHGSNELIASNHMDIIDAATVDGKASVVYWREDSDSDEPLDPLQYFWRQTHDVHQSKHGLSKLPLHCVDQKEFNPNELLVQCDSCKSWLHNKCLEKEAIRQQYEKHDLKYTESPPKPQEGPAAPEGRSGTHNILFSAHLDLGIKSDKLILTITDHRIGRVPATWQLPTISCLLCGNPIESPTPTYENDIRSQFDSSSHSSKSLKSNEDLQLRLNSQKSISRSTKSPTPSLDPDDDHVSPTTTPSKSARTPETNPDLTSDDANSFSDAEEATAPTDRSGEVEQDGEEIIQRDGKDEVKQSEDTELDEDAASESGTASTPINSVDAETI
ncbi:hypothetical protein B0J11DRAFT_314356 [Dendryphion nanum]|uniref:BAH domain-containing protein n=1 Tax=Dendryphion nanum TaxID=256645 RepID=A0A9P9ILH3_9PLEO|nr:hypothetical protein B0J11DRAFT_314356 [Dendryphion nanum]